MPHDLGTLPGASAMLTDPFCYLHPHLKPCRLAEAVSAALFYQSLAVV